MNNKLKIGDRIKFIDSDRISIKPALIGKHAIIISLPDQYHYYPRVKLAEHVNDYFCSGRVITTDIENLKLIKPIKCPKYLRSTQ